MAVGKDKSLVTKAREHAGITMTELARRVHMPLPTLSKIENGTRKLQIEEVVKFANALGCHEKALLPVPVTVATDEETAVHV